MMKDKKMEGIGEHEVNIAEWVVLSSKGDREYERYYN